MKPLISYYGGKQRQLANLLKYMPVHKIFVEPFLGAGTVFFGKKISPLSVGNPIHYREVINDKDGLIVNLYRVMQNPRKAGRLIRMLEFTPYSRDIYTEAMEVISEPKEDKYDDIKRAWALMQIQQMFSAQIGAGWSYQAKVENKPITLINKFDKKRLIEYTHRLKHAYIENRDAIEVIKTWDTVDTFYYLDPPYVKADQGHYKGYTETDLQKLVDTLKGIKGKFMLSSYNNNDIIPDNWIRKDFKAVMSAAKDRSGIDKTRIESIWMNYETHDCRQTSLI